MLRHMLHKLMLIHSSFRIPCRPNFLFDNINNVSSYFERTFFLSHFVYKQHRKEDALSCAREVAVVFLKKELLVYKLEYSYMMAACKGFTHLRVGWAQLAFTKFPTY